jgi:hypothetical protein
MGARPKDDSGHFEDERWASKAGMAEGYKKEIKTLIDSGTFAQDKLKDREISTPVMDTFKVKVKSDGSLDKLKCRLVVRGDLQDKNIMEDKWSPTASFHSLKMFLAHASRIKA